MPLQPGWISGPARVLQWPVWIAGSLVLFSSSSWSLSICILYNFNSVWCCHSCFHWCRSGIPHLYFYSNWIKILGVRGGIQVNSSHTRILKLSLILQALGKSSMCPLSSLAASFASCLWPDLDLPHQDMQDSVVFLPLLGRTHQALQAACSLSRLQGSQRGWMRARAGDEDFWE